MSKLGSKPPLPNKVSAQSLKQKQKQRGPVTGQMAGQSVDGMGVPLKTTPTSVDGMGILRDTHLPYRR